MRLPRLFTGVNTTAMAGWQPHLRYGGDPPSTGPGLLLHAAIARPMPGAFTPSRASAANRAGTEGERADTQRVGVFLPGITIRPVITSMNVLLPGCALPSLYRACLRWPPEARCRTVRATTGHHGGGMCERNRASPGVCAASLASRSSPGRAPAIHGAAVPTGRWLPGTFRPM